MSLNTAERRTTSAELMANFELSGLAPKVVQKDLGLSRAQLDRTLDLGPTSLPAAVHTLRGYLDAQIRSQGKEPLPYTLL